MNNKSIIHKNTCVENLIKNLNVQRNNKQFCDLTIKSNDGETFLVHKNVICAASSFFETLFNTNFSDKDSDVIKLSKIPSDVLKKLIEFMYGEEIVTQVEEIRNVLDGALFLGLYNLVDSCTEALIKTINKTNKFELLNFAETYINIHGEKLAKECIKFILNDDDFQTIIKSEDFIQLSFDTIKILVSIERNESINEENLFLSLIEWISSDIGNREQYINPLINEIHFDQISNAFLSKIYKDYDNLRKSNGFLQKMLELTSFLSLQKDGPKKLNLPSINSNIYAVFGNEMIMLDLYRNDFSKFIATTDFVDFAYTNFKNQGMFLCGGWLCSRNNQKLNTCKYFSFLTNQFHELPAMQNDRNGHRAVTLYDQIYVYGGNVTSRGFGIGSIYSMEIFDLYLNSWRNGCNSNKQYLDFFGLCTLYGSIYATKSNYLERFDPRESRWTILSENDSQSSHCEAVGYNNFIYKFDKSGCKKFDIRQNKWINYAIQNVGGEIRHACLVDNEIYAVNSDYNMFHLNCENDSIIKKYKVKASGTPYALLFV